MSDEPDYLTLVEAARYDDTGRITGYVKQAIGFTEREIANGARLLIADGDWDQVENRLSHYVDLSSGDPVIKDRPTLDVGLDKTSVPVGAEATLKAVPACMVAYTGPVNGTYEHPGGTLKIGFSVPGQYRISFEAFPNLPSTYELTVTP
jgi:hypothetical protein